MYLLILSQVRNNRIYRQRQVLIIYSTKHLSLSAIKLASGGGRCQTIVKKSAFYSIFGGKCCKLTLQIAKYFFRRVQGFKIRETWMTKPVHVVKQRNTEIHL